MDGHDAFPGRDVSELVDALCLGLCLEAVVADEAVVDVAEVKIVLFFVSRLDGLDERSKGAWRRTGVVKLNACAKINGAGSRAGKS